MEKAKHLSKKFDVQITDKLEQNKSILFALLNPDSDVQISGLKRLVRCTIDENRKLE
jgi:hypothetical protein